jgi:Domain of unknown function (DUF4381)
MNDPGDLAGLRDIVAPSDFPLFPLAPGVWILIAALAAIVVLHAWWAWQRFRANAYRRAAVRELKLLAASPESQDAQLLLGVSAVLKRVALISYGRERVASLSGVAWATFIAQQAPPGTDTEIIANAFGNALRAKKGPVSLRPLIAAAKAWVRRHRPSGEG